MTELIVFLCHIRSSMDAIREAMETMRRRASSRWIQR